MSTRASAASKPRAPKATKPAALKTTTPAVKPFSEPQERESEADRIPETAVQFVPLGLPTIKLHLAIDAAALSAIEEGSEAVRLPGDDA